FCTVMVRVGGGWMALDEFLVKNDPCRGRRRLCLSGKFTTPGVKSNAPTPVGGFSSLSLTALLGMAWLL
uniref:GAR domain-containing protein n=1 Tax=Laticauda laticaudata TaxID=8630 RepID=A0A8C5RWA2_LATLA